MDAAAEVATQSVDLLPQTLALATRLTGAHGATVSAELELVSDRHSFDALEQDWNDLFARAGRPAQVFQTFSWNRLWADHYLSKSPADGIRLNLIIARRNGRLIMVWPLVRERVRGIAQVFWMGEPITQYGDVLVDDIPDAMDVMREGYRFLARSMTGDLLRLRRVRADAVVAPLLSEFGATVADRQLAPFMNLASARSFDDFEKRYSSHARKNRRRLARRFGEMGTMTFERHHGGAKAAALALAALDMKTEWLKARGLVSNALTDARMARFFADAAGGAQGAPECVVSALRCNGEPAAIEISFTCKGRLAMHVIVYNLKFEKAGAGVLLLEQSLRDGYAEKLDVYDMLAPGDAYKFDWCDQSVEVTDWVKPLSLRGYAYARIYLGFLRSRAKSALRAIPHPVRKMIGPRNARTVP